MHFVIFSGGEFIPSELSKKAILQADVIIAADSGANIAIKHNVRLSAVVGDLDSISTTTKKILTKQKIPFVNVPTTLLSLPKGHTKPQDASEKDQTDTELAISYALQQGAKKITILGGVEGDRLDHIIANVLLVTVYDVPIYFINRDQIIWSVKGPSKQHIAGKKGDILSLISLTPKVIAIISQNLYYPLTNTTLHFGKPRGISNLLTRDNATISFKKGILLFIHTTHA